ncbi:ribosome production factor 2 [Rhizophagus clarus]|uniref:Ribosome production factor 2 homolog n=1 Tax=Rhizophagus clarus TaxID=94130 RepID=A0A8H3LTE1_9GLOM|nr:ribosome production factor 2 [Rhizophagus clarus]
MLKKIKPKNARSKRALQKREPKIEENVKKAIFIRSSSTNQLVNEALSDLCKLKKPDAISFTKKNNTIHPFDDDTSLNFFCEKNDTSLFVIGSHSKKRPNNLTFIRMFDGQILDMVEVGIENAKPLSEFKTSKCAIGIKPLFLFVGDLFENSLVYKTFKNMLLDFYHGQTVKNINLSGVYTIQYKKSGEKTPRVELEEMGPSYNFRIRRFKFANDDVYKLATRIPKINKPKKIKNIDVNEMGDKIGRIHLGKQDLSKLQTRKMKGLKRTTEDYTEVDLEEMEEIPPIKKQKAS